MNKFERFEDIEAYKEGCCEGFERDLRQEFIRFLFIAKGSAGEVRTQLYIAKNLEYIDAKTFDELIDKAKYVSSLIVNLIKYLKKR